MSDKIDETLKKIAAGISKGNTPTSSSTNQPASASPGQPGDPNCPVCGGSGYYRLDVPVGHPEFGKIHVCACRSGELADNTRRRLYAISHLDELRHLTFENFQLRGALGLPPEQAASVERAYNHAVHFAQHLEGWLMLHGGYGCGKTHLAAAIGNFAVSRGVITLFVTVPDLLDSLRFAYNAQDTTFEQRFEEIRRAPLLILDDFGTQNATPWAQEKLFQIINFRYTNRLPMVVTTNLPLRDIDERISSRLQDPELVTRHQIMAPDYRRPSFDMGQPQLSSLHLHGKHTFATFDLRKRENLSPEELQSLEKAFKGARAFAEDPRGWLVLIGSYGSGKTHLAAAIANYRADLGQQPLFVVVPDLMDYLRAAFNPNSTASLDRRFDEVRTTPLLVLDDLGTQSSTPWVREKLYQLFNHRYNAELPTVITTANTLSELDDRLVTRLIDRRLSTIYAITAPSYTSSPLTDTRPAAPAKKGRK